MRLFTITIGPRGAPRLVFQAMAPDSCTAIAQHADLTQLGGRVEATLVPSEQDLIAADVARSIGKACGLHEGNDRAALELQPRDMRCAGAL